jgi:tripartite-type tricarboxylate transporter receptor subunit TctC
MLQTRLMTLAGALAAALLTTAAVAADWPDKSKAINFIVAYPPGGGTDTTARVMVPLLEKELGVPVQIVNKGGAGGQIGFGELARARPDGYTIGYLILPTVPSIYLDPDRQATFSRKSFDLVAMQDSDPGVLVVQASSPFKSLQDFVDAAKVSPGKIRVATSGIMSDDHIAAMMTEKAAGVKFATVHFDGGGPSRTALLGGHVDGLYSNASEVHSQVNGKELRIIAVFDPKRSRFYPDVKTADEQSYVVHSGVYRGVGAPIGVPTQARDVLAAALKKVITGEEFTKRMQAIYYDTLYMESAAYAKFWDDFEGGAKAWVDMGKQK